MTNSRVKEVKDDKILFSQKDDDGQITTKELPMGFCLWSTGVCKPYVGMVGRDLIMANELCSTDRLMQEICKEARRTKQQTRS